MPVDGASGHGYVHTPRPMKCQFARTVTGGVIWHQRCDKEAIEGSTFCYEHDPWCQVAEEVAKVERREYPKPLQREFNRPARDYLPRDEPERVKMRSFLAEMEWGEPRRWRWEPGHWVADVR